MKQIKSFILAAVAFALVAPVFTACSSDDDDKTKENIILSQRRMLQFCW